jgi:hypothetical protein
VKVATLLRSILATAVLAVLAVAPVRAQLTPEAVSGFSGRIQATPDGAALKGHSGGTINVATIVYDNTASAANFGVSSTDLASIWGDELVMLSGGPITDHVFSIFNSGSSPGPLLTCTAQVSFYDGPSSVLLGTYNVNLNFGAGLAPGFFTLVGVNGLGASGIVLGSDVIVTQRITALTGTANRLGIASLNPPTVGASPASMYISSATIGGGVAGFYTFGNGPANPANQVTVDLTPVGTKSSTWGAIKRLYH